MEKGNFRRANNNTIMWQRDRDAKSVFKNGRTLINTAINIRAAPTEQTITDSLNLF